MSTATSSLRYLLARAGMRADARMHIVSERDTSLLNPICAAHPIRSAKIDTWEAAPADLSTLCQDCATLAAGIPGIGTLEAGIAVFLGHSTDGAPVALLTEVPIVQIDLAPSHARHEPGDIEGLVASIEERGFVAPVLLRRKGSRFEVIDGGRRISAAWAAKRETVPAIIRDVSDADLILDGLIANVHREELNPIELAEAYERALPFVGGNKAELGRRLGISREQISNTIRLLNLPAADQAAIAAGAITAEGGRKLLATPKPPAAKFDDVAVLLAQLLAAKVNVTARGGRTRIVIDVDDADAPRLLGQLNQAAIAA